MDERDKRRVGEQIEPGGRPKAPGRLELLQRFINSYNHDFPREWDRIGTPERAQAWLRQKRLVAPGDRISDADVARLRELREAIRALAIANQGREPGAAATDIIRRVSGTAQLSVAIDDTGRTALEPTRRGVDGAVATLLGILHEAQLTGRLVTPEGLSPVRVRVLRPLEEPIGGLVRHVDLRQSDEESRVLPAPPYR